MKKFLFLISLLASSLSLSAQQDINLLDLIKDESTVIDSVREAVPSATPASTYDWRSHRHSLTFSTGSTSVIETSGAALVWMLTAFWTNGENLTHFMPPFSVEYDYNALKWLRVGGRFTYQYSHILGQLPVTHAFLTTGRLDFTYLNRRKCKLYSGIELGLGLAYNSYKDQQSPGYKNYTKPYLGASVCLFGLQAGGDHAYFMTELNLGNIDALRIGIGTHF